MTVATALMFGVAQIIEGSDKCAYCQAPATLTTWNGADPDPESVCSTHAIQMFDTTRHAIFRLFPPRTPGEDAPPAIGTAA